jgi:superfamily II DNA/RNA helicase
MPFKKLIEPLKDALIRKEFEAPLPFQKQILSKIKGGANVFGIGPKDCGKTSSLIISVIQKLKGKAFEDAPRALIFVKDKQAALALAEEFKTYIKGTDLRVYCVYEEHNIDLQREELYIGTDIVIATPKRLNKVFYMNGIDLNQLQLFIVDDAEFIFANDNLKEIARIPESIKKCQYVIFSTKFDARFNRWKETFMYNSQIIKAK